MGGTCSLSPRLRARKQLAVMLGAIVSGLTSLASGILGRDSARKRAEAETNNQLMINNQSRADATAMNIAVQKRAQAAAKVPIVTKTVNKPTVVTSSPTTVRTTHISNEGVYTKSNLADLVKDAEANGFNPLSVLRAGGLGSYSTSRNFGGSTDTTYSSGGKVTTSGGDTTTTVTGSTAMDAALAGQHLPMLMSINPQTQVPGVGEVIGNAINAGVNQWQDDRRQSQQNQHQMDMLNAQLSGANQRGSAGGWFGSPRAVTAGGNFNVAGGGGLAPASTYKKPGDLLFAGGAPIYTDPGTSNAEDWETRYSDPGGWIGGVIAADIDLGLNLRKHGLPATPWEAGAMAREYMGTVYDKVTDWIENFSPSKPGNYGRPYDSSNPLFQ